MGRNPANGYRLFQRSVLKRFLATLERPVMPLSRMVVELRERTKQSAKLDKLIRACREEIGYGG